MSLQQDVDSLFLIFRDASNSSETYSAGRFLEAHTTASWEPPGWRKPER